MLEKTELHVNTVLLQGLQHPRPLRSPDRETLRLLTERKVYPGLPWQKINIRFVTENVWRLMNKKFNLKLNILFCRLSVVNPPAAASLWALPCPVSRCRPGSHRDNEQQQPSLTLSASFINSSISSREKVPPATANIFLSSDMSM